MSEETKQDAPAYDDRGNVRPTDARYTGGDRPKITPQEQAAIRDKEIKAGWARVADQQQKVNAENEQRLADAVAAVSPAPDVVDDDQADYVDPIEDRYTDMPYADLQQEAKNREGMSAGGSADELRDRLRADDEAKA